MFTLLPASLLCRFMSCLPFEPFSRPPSRSRMSMKFWANLNRKILMKLQQRPLCRSRGYQVDLSRVGIFLKQQELGHTDKVICSQDNENIPSYLMQNLHRWQCRNSVQLKSYLTLLRCKYPCKTVNCSPSKPLHQIPPSYISHPPSPPTTF